MDLKPLTPEEIALVKAAPHSHRNTRQAIERIAELQVARYCLTDTVEEYIAKTSKRTAENEAKTA